MGQVFEAAALLREGRVAKPSNRRKVQSTKRLHSGFSTVVSFPQFVKKYLSFLRFVFEKENAKKNIQKLGGNPLNAQAWHNVFVMEAEESL